MRVNQIVLFLSYAVHLRRTPLSLAEGEGSGVREVRVL